MHQHREVLLTPYILHHRIYPRHEERYIQLQWQRYERGKICYDLKIVGDCDIEDTGTQVTFLPDSEIFQETTVFEFDILMHRLREMAFLTKGIKITLSYLC